MTRKKQHVRVSDVRGYGRLAIDATLGLTSLVEIVHHNILRTPGVFGKPTQQPARGITGFVYKSIRGVTRLVGGSIDLVLGQLAPLLDSGVSSSEREAVLAALNGVLGDHLEASKNTLAVPMQLRREGKSLELARDGPKGATGKVLLMVHGLCMNDLQWRRKGHDHGAALAAEGGFTPVYVRYNSGLHISTNGQLLAEQIEALVRAWPVPIDELVVLAHSMGGLVARSACHYGALARHDWLRHLRQIVFLGTPHHGAPLERGGNWTDLILQSSPYTIAFARLGRIRSAGITDLRYGSLLDEDWQGTDRFVRSQPNRVVALPSGVKCYAIAASIAQQKGAPVKQLLGDGLVPLDSALGRHADPSKCLAFPKNRQWVGYGMNHMDLLDRNEVCAQLKRWLCA
jgi:pimeloyl-ACP methyl ester carboxylesterase